MATRKGNIKTIVLDLHGVYVNHGDSSYPEVCKFLGCTLEELYKAEAAANLSEYTSGMISERQFWDGISTSLGFDKKLVPKVKKIIYVGYRTNAGMPQLAKSLRKRYRMILFSGIPKDRFDYLDAKYRLHSVFDDFLLSFKVKHRKSEAGDVFFRMLLTKIRGSPDECIYVDDRMRNIVRGKALGLNTIHFKNVTQLERELRKLGV